MKKLTSLLSIFLCLIFIVGCSSPFANCNGCQSCGKKEEVEKPTFTEYTIQYFDGQALQSVTVKSGSLFSIESIPKKTGYEFLGLFDAETGGTQYVNAAGSSLDVFNDKRSLVLYPQFKPKEYTLVLDYQGAAVTGVRSMQISYDSLITELPMDVSMENKTFVGWFTKPNKQGLQVADQYGVIPANNKVTESRFDLTDKDGYVFLYAGFKAKEYTLTLYHTSLNTPEEIKVEHGTHISEVVSEVRVDGKAAYSWSKTKSGSEPFDGKITSDMILYAYEYAPVITFNTNGGETLDPLVALEGQTIYLPEAERENYAFSHWQTEDGSVANINSMPETSLVLKAIWLPMINFDVRGGTDVEGIAQLAGTRVTMPTTSRDGYIFAGWYTLNNQKYKESAMPKNSITLKAMWYKIKTATKIFINKDAATGCAVNYNTSPSTSWYRSVDISDIPQAIGVPITIKGYVEACHTYGSATQIVWMAVSFYDSITISDSNLLSEHSFNLNNANYNEFEFESSWTVRSSNIYVCLYGQCAGNIYEDDKFFRDLYIEITYPDTSTLC